MSNLVKIKKIEHLTHDVLRIVTEKPESLNYQPGQAADISLNKEGWEQELRAFTFVSLPGDDYVEFNIKVYPSHNGVTNQLLSLSAGNELFIHDVFGDIAYKGKGIFIAGGAGITPFIAIMKDLEKQNKLGGNKLIFANKTKADIIREDDFRKLLGNNFINILSDETREGYSHGFVTADLIKGQMNSDLNYFYICGPDPMMEAIEKQLVTLGVSQEFIVREGF
ncbi:MAG: flavodoxin reductase [Bacteroidales bacterium]|jgi:ferredoxin-NADP reductase|nr:flavodoxin reductase [Bacteroidales bacterium]